MSCERYWREGIVLVERGVDDPHRRGCENCTRAHASRQKLIEALPLIGAGDTGDPDWRAKVWERIDGKRAKAPRPWRWRWQLGGALAVGCVVALWLGLGRMRGDDARPQLMIIEGSVPMRSQNAPAGDRVLNAHVGDRVRATVGETSDVWIYRANHLALQCGPRRVSIGCAPDVHGMVVDLLLSDPGVYRVIILKAPGALVPRGTLDEDLATLESAGVAYEHWQVSVR